MTGLLRRLFRRDGPPPDYEASKSLARDDDVGVRRNLAGREDVRPELLYYLAEDPAVEVRRAIAANPATPRQADLLLARDADATVRIDLADKIGRIAPQLSGDERDQICRLTWQVLEILAEDQVTRVRRILSEALKEVATVPPAVVRRLAQDTELTVAAPVLEFSPLLSEGDLCQLIERGIADGALAAIARRRGVGGPLADAIFGADDADATAALLANHSAQIRETTLDRILDKAPAVERWHEPLAHRPLLPPAAVRRLAEFVAERLLAVLQRRSDLDAATVASLRETVQRRLGSEAAGDEPSTEAPGEPLEDPQARAARLHGEGRLDEACLGGALAGGDHAFVSAGLALLSGLPAGIVRRVGASASAKGITAVAWKAGLSMRFAIQLQLRYARVPPKSILAARDGVDYPMSPAEMDWQLELFQSLAER